MFLGCQDWRSDAAVDTCEPLRGPERVWEDGARITRNRTRGAGAYPVELCELWVSLVQKSIGHLFRTSTTSGLHECQQFERRLLKAAVAKRVRGQGPAGSIAGGNNISEDTELAVGEASI